MQQGQAICLPLLGNHFKPQSQAAVSSRSLKPQSQAAVGLRVTAY